MKMLGMDVLFVLCTSRTIITFSHAQANHMITKAYASLESFSI